MFSIRNPVFGNTFTTSTRTKIQMLMDSDVVIFQPATSPIVEGFSVSFEALTEAEMLRFKSFVTAGAGEILQFQDHEQTDWEVVIKSEEIVFTERRDCQWQTSVEFEGRRSNG